jgi:hypothetical protein
LKRKSKKKILKQNGQSKITEKGFFVFEAKRLKRNSEKNQSETMRNKAKKTIFDFEKTAKNEAKQDAFRFIMFEAKI